MLCKKLKIPTERSQKSSSKLHKKVIANKSQTTFSRFIASSTYFFLMICIFYCCKEVPSSEYLQLSGKQKITFLDSIRAAAVVTTDRQEDFFEKVTPLDISLQMQRTYPSETSREIVLKDYKKFLAEEVLPFEAQEEAILKKVFTDIHTWCDQLSPTIFPKNIQLIKTKGSYYGDGAYYTRENVIVIPMNELKTPNEPSLRAVIAHEIFHIYSRQNPKKRDALYALIGFQKVNGKLVLPSILQSRQLLNPDGIDVAYAIRLAQPGGDTLQTIPIITSNAPSYLPARKSFFEYMEFNLYPIEKQADGNYNVIVSPEGISPLKLNEQGNFFKQITDNTQYIIHPDEILADNFSYLILSKSGDAAFSLERFSKEGKELLKKIEKILKE